MRPTFFSTPQVPVPKEEPRLPQPLFGFTQIAEVWNSRASLIGLIALVALEFVSIFEKLDRRRQQSLLLNRPACTPSANEKSSCSELSAFLLALVCMPPAAEATEDSSQADAESM